MSVFVHSETNRLDDGCSLFSGALAALFILAMTPRQARPKTFQVGNTTLTASNVTSGIQLPWELLWGPDDFLWVTTRPGTVYRIILRRGHHGPDKSVTNNGSGEPGMLGMARTSNGRRPQGVHRVHDRFHLEWHRALVRVRLNGVSLVNEQILLTSRGGHPQRKPAVGAPRQHSLDDHGRRGDGGQAAKT